MKSFATFYIAPEPCLPELAVLGSLFQARLEAAQARAIAHLDKVLEKKLGGPPTVEVSLELEGRVTIDAAELDRLLAEVLHRSCISWRLSTG